jgi:hypothetical protein
LDDVDAPTAEKSKGKRARSWESSRWAVVPA